MKNVIFVVEIIFVIMKIVLIGYGKMGKEIEKVVVVCGYEIVSIIDVDN